MATRKKAKALTTTQRQPASVQTRNVADFSSPGTIPSGSTSWYLWQTQTAANFGIPRYWSPKRDAWLRQFYTLPGNDLLVGTIATVVSKIETTNFFIEGPERMANMYMRIMTRDIEFGQGYSVFGAKGVTEYLTQDNGVWIERKRADGPTERPSAADGFALFDSATMTPTGDPEYPAFYLDDEGNYHKIHWSLCGHLVDMPSPDHKMNGIGFCAMSRALTTARILMLIAKYKQERLSDLPPAGLLILNNLNEQDWKDMEQKYEAGQKNQGNTVWRNVMVAFGLDPAVPAAANMVEFSSLPEHYNEDITTEVAVYSFALAFNVDPADLWPRRNTPLGTASEASISHLKARGKRTGAIYSAFERFFNDGYSLPRTCRFRFDYQDADEDLEAADIRLKNVEAIRKMFEPPNVGGQGMISLEQAQQLLVLNNCAPEFVIQSGAAETIVSDTGVNKSHVVDMGPKARVYKDGRTIRLEHRPQVHQGWSPKSLTPEAIARAMSKSESGRVAKFNPYHEPEGTPIGGQFAEAPGGAGTERGTKRKLTITQTSGMGQRIITTGSDENNYEFVGMDEPTDFKEMFQKILANVNDTINDTPAGNARTAVGRYFERQAALKNGKLMTSKYPGIDAATGEEFLAGTQIYYYQRAAYIAP